MTRFAAAALVVVAFSLIYVPMAGHGFVKDDFMWVGRSRIHAVDDLPRVLAAPSGFFRPLVSLSFAATWPICGLEPRCYGLTNVLLAIACAASIAHLARALSLPPAGALLAAAIWLFNWHGIGMGVLWISGRTALVVVLFSTLAAAEFLLGRVVTAGVLCFAAMLAKEEAVVVPVALIAWASIEIARRHNPIPARALVAFTGVSAVVTGLYLLLRAWSGAFTPTTAPTFYRLSFTPARVAANLPAYFDRSATFSAAVLLLWLALCRPPLRSIRPARWSIVRFGVAWWIGTLALTVLLPVRSSLYVCLPSVGIALIAASLIVGTWPSVPVQRRRHAVVAASLLPFVMWPILFSRGRPSVREADLSAQTIDALRRIAPAHPGATVVLNDDRSQRPSLDNVFGTLAQEAVDLTVSPHVTVWIEPPPADAALAGLTRPPHFDVTLTLRNSAVENPENR